MIVTPKAARIIYGLFCLLVFAGYSSNAQNDKIGKALALLKKDREDTNKVNHLTALCNFYSTSGKTDSALFYGNMAYTLSSQLQFKKGEANALHSLANMYENQSNYEKALSLFSQCMDIDKEMRDEKGVITNLNSIGMVYMDQGDYNKALENFTKAKEYYEKMGDKDGIASVVGNIGIVYRNLGNYPQAIENYFRAMKMYEEAGNKEGVASNAGNLGVAFMNQNDFNKALEYYSIALKTYEELGDKDGIATNLGNMGIMYVTQKSYPKALEYFFKSITINKEIGDKDGIATNTGNIGHIYYEQGDYDEALKYFADALKLDKEIGDKGGIATNIGSQGEVYLKKKEYDKAEQCLKNGLSIADSIHELDMIRDFNFDLSNLYMEKGQWQKAYEVYKEYTDAKDSLVNQDRNKEIGKLEAKEIYDKQLAVQQAQVDKKNGLAAEENKRQKIIIGFTGAVAVAVAFIALIVFRSLKTTRRQKAIIEEQKQEVEEKKIEVEKQKGEAEKQKEIVEQKNKDILDSITYAKRLQDAILPQVSEIKKVLPESFVLYKPRDIVAGDFYWMQKTDNTIFIAAADCTGHGVPGAMVSVVCSSALNRTVKEFKITEPGKILDKTRELMLETFSQRDPFGEKNKDNIEDGMDISLASLSSSKEETQIKWAGANISLWYVEDNEVKEIAGDKQSVGKTDSPAPFATHALALPAQTGTIYLFTDGFAEQIGGPQKKKFGTKQLNEQLNRLVMANMETQKAKLEQVFAAWKGSEKQTDDVLIIGIRI